ncbi:DUF2180 family protein [Streptomyces sp. NPDC058964]|uniref:DUF2180 family protein n=1 Tax=Streptomyces sp. NPDC058964 TaxID=3346681 RepID=UPI003673D518
MYCYDCPESLPTGAVAVCARCGVGLCRAHLHEGRVGIQDVVGTGRATHDRPVRHITCKICQSAEVS